MGDGIAVDGSARSGAGGASGACTGTATDGGATSTGTLTASGGAGGAITVAGGWRSGGHGSERAAAGWSSGIDRATNASIFPASMTGVGGVSSRMLNSNATSIPPTASAAVPNARACLGW
jgi:hypothetical protein